MKLNNQHKRMRPELLGFFIGLYILLQDIAAGRSLSQPRTQHGLRLKKCSIYVLDAQKDIPGLPSCSLQFAATYQEQLLSSQDPRLAGKEVGGPELSQYSRGYWLAEGIRRSPSVVENIDNATAVFVDDYCYQAQWIAALHSLQDGSDVELREKEQIFASVFERLKDLPRWQQHMGADFGVNMEHPYVAEQPLDAMCSLGQTSFGYAEDTVPYSCPPPRRSRMGIELPYTSPGFWLEPQPEPVSRDRLAFFIGTCAGTDDLNVGHGNEGLGKHIRTKVITQLQQSLPGNVAATLSCSLRLKHAEVVDIMRRTKFCLLMPGDSVSSRRLAEIVLAGCIPVFLGSPYHNTPLSTYIKYPAFSIFFNVEDLKDLPQWKPALKKQDQTRSAKLLLDSEWWIPTIELEDHAITLRTADIIAHLLGLPEAVVDAKLAAVAAARSFFTFDPNGGQDGSHTAIDLFIDSLCGAAESAHSGQAVTLQEHLRQP